MGTRMANNHISFYRPPFGISSSIKIYSRTVVKPFPPSPRFTYTDSILYSLLKIYKNKE